MDACEGAKSEAAQAAIHAIDDAFATDECREWLAAQVFTARYARGLHQATRRGQQASVVNGDELPEQDLICGLNPYHGSPSHHEPESVSRIKHKLTHLVGCRRPGRGFRSVHAHRSGLVPFCRLLALGARPRAQSSEKSKIAEATTRWAQQAPEDVCYSL